MNSKSGTAQSSSELQAFTDPVLAVPTSPPGEVRAVGTGVCVPHIGKSCPSAPPTSMFVLANDHLYVREEVLVEEGEGRLSSFNDDIWQAQIAQSVLADIALIRNQASRINVGPDPDTLGELDWEVPSELPVLGPPRSAASSQSPFHQPGMCTGWSDSGLSESDKHSS